MSKKAASSKSVETVATTKKKVVKPVKKLTPMTPVPTGDTGPSSPDASRRRAATPTELPGTTTVTGASGDVAFARAISARNASAAARP